MVFVWSLCFKLLENVKSMPNLDKHLSKICFMLLTISRMVILASVELCGELVQEIHHILHSNELKAILYLVLIAIKPFLTFLSAKKTRNKLTLIKSVLSSFHYQMWCFSYAGLYLY